MLGCMTPKTTLPPLSTTPTIFNSKTLIHSTTLATIADSTTKIENLSSKSQFTDQIITSFLTEKSTEISPFSIPSNESTNNSQTTQTNVLTTQKSYFTSENSFNFSTEILFTTENHSTQTEPQTKYSPLTSKSIIQNSTSDFTIELQTSTPNFYSTDRMDNTSQFTKIERTTSKTNDLQSTISSFPNITNDKTEENKYFGSSTEIIPFTHQTEYQERSTSTMKTTTSISNPDTEKSAISLTTYKTTFTIIPKISETTETMKSSISTEYYTTENVTQQIPCLDLPIYVIYGLYGFIVSLVVVNAILIILLVRINKNPKYHNTVNSFGLDIAESRFL